MPSLISVRPARTYSNGCKSPNLPDSGKVTAKGKGVHREVESEGSRRQTVGPMNKNLVEGWKPKGFRGVQTFMEITEDKIVELQVDEQHLLELIVSSYNISRAIRKVMSKRHVRWCERSENKSRKKTFVFLLLD